VSRSDLFKTRLQPIKQLPRHETELSNSTKEGKGLNENGVSSCSFHIFSNQFGTELEIQF
jgi:hypothetical protein